MIARKFIFSRKMYMMFFALFSFYCLESRHNVVTFSELEILQTTAQGQGTLNEINKFEDESIALIEEERLLVVASEQEIMQLQQQHEQRVNEMQKNGVNLTIAQQKSLEQESTVLRMAMQELTDLQNQFYRNVDKAKKRIDDYYVRATARFFNTIFAKYAPLRNWDIVISANSSGLLFAGKTVDVTQVILKELKKQRDIQSKKFTTITEVKSLFADLGLVYIESNIMAPELTTEVKRSLQQYYEQRKSLMDHYLHVYGAAIAQKKRVPMSVGWISDKVGWGVFAAEDISDGEFIQEYTGVFVATVPGVLFDATYAWELFRPEGAPQLLVDSMSQGNEMRFVNHSNHPNVVSQILVGLDNKYHVCYLAKGFIKAGEQLLVSYGQKYWDRRKNFEELYD